MVICPKIVRLAGVIHILTTVNPGKSLIGMLSIPRDLWVTIPGFGENRINTAHFFAEANQPGTGPAKVKETISKNFGVDVNHYIRINFAGFRDVIDAMGGVRVDLPEPMAGYEAGSHVLTGKKALAFARNRTDTDDFFRMAQGQLLIKSIIKQNIMPTGWLRLPGVLVALCQAVDTDIPVCLWPRIIFNLLFVSQRGMEIDHKEDGRQRGDAG